MSRPTILILCLAALTAQPGHADDTLSTQTGDQATLYRLDADAYYIETCFAPCPCPPPGDAIPLRGTFVLGAALPGNAVDFRRIAQANWTAGFPDNVVHRMVGDGVYKVTNFSPVKDESLELRLTVDGSGPQYFFSDFVPADDDPKHLNIDVSLNGMFCQDTVLHVSATAVSPQDIVRYQLAEGSTYQQGCFDPCDCILEEPRPLLGGFALVELFNAGTYAEFALVHSRLAVPGSDASPGIRFNGLGRYTLIQGFAGPAHALDWWLRPNNRPAMHFGAGLENATSIFPEIDITVDMNDQVCFDRVLNIKARPAAVQ